MVYLIAGLDRTTFARWHDHVMAADVTIATRIAHARAAAQGVELVVAAVVGPYSSLVSDAADPSPSASMAAHPRFLRSDAAESLDHILSGGAGFEPEDELPVSR